MKTTLGFIQRNKLPLIFLLLIVTVNLFFTYLPLTNLLHYESSSLNSILISLVSGLYWLHNGRSKKFKFNLSFFSLLLIAPLIILLISTVFCQNCPLDQGIFFYFIFTIPAVFVGMAISLFARFVSFKFRFICFLLIWLTMLLGFAPELYLNPQIYFYNAIFVYFPGVIYDQNIELSQKLIYYRALNLIISLIIIYLLNRTFNFNKITKLIVIIGFISGYLHSYNFKNTLNFSTDIDRIENSLKTALESENFKIYMPDSVSENQIKTVLNEHEYHYHSIQNIIGSNPENKITSFLFNSGAQKKELFGSGNADVAKPWLNQIYLNQNNYRLNLKHELAHIFSAEFGKGPLKIPPNYNPGIIEGFAMAIENDFDNYDIDYLAALAYSNDYKVDLNSLFTDMSFFSSASSISYIYAGSFFKHLTDRYGWHQLKRIYSGESFEEVYKNSLSELVESYHEYLDSLKDFNNEHQSNYYFGYRPLIKRFCARATAKELKEALGLFNSNNFSEAAVRYLAIYQYSFTYASLIGFAKATKETGDISSATEFLERELHNFEGSSSFYYLEFLLADFYALMEDSSNAARYYNSIISQNPQRSYFRNALLNKTLLERGDSILINYLTEKELKKTIILDLIKSEKNEFFIEHLIYNSDILRVDYQTTIELVKEFESQKPFNSFTNFIISNFSYLNMDLIEALSYSEKSLIKVEPSREAVFRDHNEKLKYIINKN